MNQRVVFGSLLGAVAISISCANEPESRTPQAILERYEALNIQPDFVIEQFEDQYLTNGHVNPQGWVTLRLRLTDSSFDRALSAKQHDLVSLASTDSTAKILREVAPETSEGWGSFRFGRVRYNHQFLVFDTQRHTLTFERIQISDNF